MKVTGVGQYIAIRVSERTENVGEVMQPVEELGLSGEELIFFAISDIYLKGLEDDFFYVMVRPEDIYGVVVDEEESS